MINIQSFAKAKDGTSYKATSSSGFSNSKNVTASLNTHNIWGQPFNGTEDVSGNLQNVGSITANGNIQTEGDIIIRQLDEENQVVNDGDFTMSVEDNSASFSGKDKYVFDGAIEGKDIKADGNLNVTGTSNVDDIIVGGDGIFNADMVVKGYSQLNEVASNNITNSDTIRTKNLEVTGSAHFFELIIDKIKAAGGAVLFTPANGFQVDVVEAVTDGYRLYWQADDGNGNQADNMWKVNDQALCMSFNQAKEGTSHNVSNKYYWSLVTEVSDTNEPVSIEDKKYHFITISTVTYDGTVNPEVGDTIAMLGYRGVDDANRQSAIYISAYTSLDKGLKAPLLAQYRGINDFNLESHRKSYFDAVGAKFVGNFEVSNGQTIEDYINSYIDGSESGVPYIGDDGYWYVWDSSQKKYVKSNTNAKGADGHSPYIGSDGYWYFWNENKKQYEKTTYKAAGTNGKDGKDGTNGKDGTSVTITSTSVMYAIGNSATVAPTSGWSSSIVATTDANPYLWTRTIVTYSDGKSTTSYSISYKGKDGTNGKDGINGIDGTNGTNGKDAEFYRLYPVIEKAIVDKNGTLGITLQYNIKHIKGTTIYTVAAQTSGYYVRFKPNTTTTYTNLSVGTTAPNYTNTSYQTNYHKQTSKIEYLTVQLLYNGVIKDSKVVPVQFAASAALEITDSIKTTVQGNTDSISDLAGKVQTNTNNISTVTQKANSIESSVKSNTTSINSLTGKVDSNTQNISSITQKANSIESSVSSLTNTLDKTSEPRRNLIVGSYIRKVTKKYGGGSLTAQIVKGKKYTFSFNGYCTQELINKGYWLQGFAFDSNWKIQNISIPIKTTTATTVSKTFTAAYTGEIKIDFFPYKDGSTAEDHANNTAFIVVNWCQLEEGEIATPWTLAEGEPDVRENLVTDDISEMMNTVSDSTTQTIELTSNGCELQDGTTLDCIHATYTGTSYFDAVRLNSGASLDSMQSYTLSFYAKGSGQISSYLYPNAVMGGIAPDGTLYKNSDSANSSGDGVTTIQLTSEWTKYVITWTAFCSDGSTRKNLLIARLFQNADVYIAGVKFEKGGYASRYDQTKSLIRQTANSILMQVNDISLKIDNKKIVLDGDTEINGSLTMDSKDQGFLLKGGSDSATTEISPKSIGTYSSFQNTASSSIRTFKSLVAGGAETFNQEYVDFNWTVTQQLGTLPKGTYLQFTQYSATVMKWNSGTVLGTPSGTFSIFENGTKKTSINVQASKATLTTYTTSAEADVYVQATYTFRASASHWKDSSNTVISGSGNAALKPISMPTAVLNVGWINILPTSAYMLIGYDGLAVNFGNNKTAYIGNDGAIFNYGNYQLKIDSNGISQLNRRNVKVVSGAGTTSSPITYTVESPIDTVLCIATNAKVIFPKEPYEGQEIKIFDKCSNNCYVSSNSKYVVGCTDYGAGSIWTNTELGGRVPRLYTYMNGKWYEEYTG